MPLDLNVVLGPDNIVLDADPAPPPWGTATSPIEFLSHVCCGKTAGWIEMPFGTKVGLGPGHIMLLGDPVPTAQKGSTAPLPHDFWPMSIVAKQSPISATAEHLLLPCDAIQA